MSVVQSTVLSVFCSGNAQALLDFEERQGFFAIPAPECWKRWRCNSTVTSPSRMSISLIRLRTSLATSLRLIFTLRTVRHYSLGKARNRLSATQLFESLLSWIIQPVGSPKMAGNQCCLAFWTCKHSETRTNSYWLATWKMSNAISETMTSIKGQNSKCLSAAGLLVQKRPDISPKGAGSNQVLLATNIMDSQPRWWTVLATSPFRFESLNHTLIVSSRWQESVDQAIRTKTEIHVSPIHKKRYFLLTYLTASCELAQKMPLCSFPSRLKVFPSTSIGSKLFRSFKPDSSAIAQSSNEGHRTRQVSIIFVQSARLITWTICTCIENLLQNSNLQRLFKQLRKPKSEVLPGCFALGWYHLCLHKLRRRKNTGHCRRQPLQPLFCIIFLSIAIFLQIQNASYKLIKLTPGLHRLKNICYRREPVFNHYLITMLQNGVTHVS